MPADLVRQIESFTAVVWPPKEIKNVDGWALAADVGVTRRANSVLPNRWTGERSLDNAIDEVERIYKSLGLPASFKLTEASLPSDLDERLAKRNYRKEGETNVLVVSASRLMENCNQDHHVLRNPRPTKQWMSAAGLGDGSASSKARKAIMERIDPPRSFLLTMIKSEPVGAAVVSAIGGWTCISGLHVSPTQRGK
ncbi:MAG: hypothetical protein MI741_09705, partial [Rhodospirillales bacterium]|nr:hypothetical protein [Rhodospirillales bacterium]